MLISHVIQVDPPFYKTPMVIIQPVNLPEQGEKVKAGSMCLVSGWGAKSVRLSEKYNTQPYFNSVLFSLIVRLLNLFYVMSLFQLKTMKAVSRSTINI